MDDTTRTRVETPPGNGEAGRLFAPVILLCHCLSIFSLHPAPADPEFTVRLVVVVPATRSFVCQFNPFGLLSPFDVAVAENDVCSTFVTTSGRKSRPRPAGGGKAVKSDVTVKHAISVTIANRNHVGRLEHSRLGNL